MEREREKTRRYKFKLSYSEHHSCHGSMHFEATIYVDAYDMDEAIRQMRQQWWRMREIPREPMEYNIAGDDKRMNFTVEAAPEGEK